MPRGFDSKMPQADFNPLTSKLDWNIADIASEAAAALEKAVETFFDWTVTAVSQFTGVDLTQWIPLINTNLESLTTLFGDLVNFNIPGALNTFISLLETNAISITTQLPLSLIGGLGSGSGALGLSGLLGGFATNVPIIGQLVSAGGGTGNTLTDFGSMIASMAGGLPAAFLSGLTTSTSLLSQLPSLLTLPMSAITGLLGGGGTIALGNLPGLPLSQITSLPGLLSGFNTTGSTSLLSQLPSLLTLPMSAITGLLGGGGTIALGNLPGLPLSQVTALPGLLSGFNTTGSTSLLSQLPSLLTLPISAITSLAGYLTNLTSGGVLSLAGLASGTLPGGIAVPGGSLIGTVASSLLTGTLGAGLLPTILPSMTSGLAPIDTIVNALGLSGTGFGTTDLTSVMQNINPGNVLGVLGGPNMGGTVGMLTDKIVQGLLGNTSTGNSFANVANAAGTVQSTATDALTLGQNHDATLTARAVTKPGFLSMDASADPTFPIVLAGTSTLGVTQANSVIGAIGIPDAGIKTTAWWNAPALPPATITAIYLNLYTVNVANDSRTWITSSPNLVTNAIVGYNGYTFPTDYVANQGDWYIVEMVVIGTGTYSIVGLSGQTYNNADHPTAVPKRHGAQRTIPSVMPTLDAIGNGYTGVIGSGTTNVSTSGLTITPGATATVAYLCVSWSQNNGTASATYNGVAMTNILNTQYIAQGTTIAYSMSVFEITAAQLGLQYLPNSATPVVFTAKNGTSGHNIAVAANVISLNNAGGHGTVQVGAVGSGTAVAQTVTDPGANNYNLQVVSAALTTAGATYGNYLVNGAAGTTLWNQPANYPSSQGLFIGSPGAGGNGNAATALTLSVAPNPNGWQAVNIPVRGMLQPAPATIANPEYTNNIPWFALGGVAAPVTYQPVPHAYAPAGNYSLTLPTWAKFVDLMAVGGAAGGNCGDGGAGQHGSGGLAGARATTTLVVGTDIAIGGTINFTVGAAGFGGNGSGSPQNGRSNNVNNGIYGTSGTSTSATWTKPGVGAQSLVAAGGAFNTTQFGGTQAGGTPTPNPQTVSGQNYYAGSGGASSNAPGNPPGGAGAGGNGGFYTFYDAGANGADGEAWAYVRQS